jgi:hypothetical protein
MAQPRTHKAKSRKLKGGAAFESPRVQHALSTLSARGVLGKGGTTKVSARLDPGLLEAAREKIGAKTDTELLTAALAVVAGGDDFGAWLVSRGERLPADFELEF